MNTILEVRDLEVVFSKEGGIFRAVRGVSFSVEANSVFGIVGESGSGKTITALSILKLIYPPGRIEKGEVIFNGKDLLSMDEEGLRRIRGALIAMVFQEPSAALNPVLTIGAQLSEAVTAHRAVGKPAAKELVKDYLNQVHITDGERVYHSYPHQLSGGMKQRAMIAMALVNEPALLILDEPTTALDVTIQAQILDLVGEIIERKKISAIFISHDFSVIAKMCDRVAVMKDGLIVEAGAVDAVLSDPREAYTRTLLDSARALA